MGAAQSNAQVPLLSAEAIAERNEVFYAAHPGLESHATAIFASLDPQAADNVEFALLYPQLHNLVLAVFGPVRFSQWMDKDGTLDMQRIKPQLSACSLKLDAGLTTKHWLTMINIWFTVMEAVIADEMKEQQRVAELAKQHAEQQEAAQRQLIEEYVRRQEEENKRMIELYTAASEEAKRQWEEAKARAIAQNTCLVEARRATEEAVMRDAEEQRQRIVAEQQKQYEEFIAAMNAVQQRALEIAEQSDMNQPHLSRTTGELRTKRRVAGCM